MASNLSSELSLTQSQELIARLGRFGVSPEVAKLLRGDDYAMRFFVLAGLDSLERNPFEMTVEQQLAALHLANNEEKWGIGEEVFARLAATAPGWPKGKSAYRSLRIRFGEGGEGVAKTFEAHVARVKSVFTEKDFWRQMFLRSALVQFNDKPVDCLRLLSGNNTHKPVVEWVTVDLGTHRDRKSVTKVRNEKSLADELLVISWMFPDMIRAIDNDTLPGLFAGGYEVNVHEYGNRGWRSAVLVGFLREERKVGVCADDRGNRRSGFSVPVLLE